VSEARLSLVNADFDTGQSTRRGEYSLADDTYDELLGKLAARAFADVSEDLRSDLVAYYGNLDSLPTGTSAQRKRATRIRQQLAPLDAR